jgi:hypothetical protein
MVLGLEFLVCMNVRPGWMCDMRSMSLYYVVGELSFVFFNLTIILIKYIIVVDLGMKRVWGDRTPREGKGAKGLRKGIKLGD